MISIPKALQNPRRAAKASTNGASPASQARTAPPAPPSPALGNDLVVDLERRRDQLIARVAELQWDLGGLVYEMAIRNRIQVEVLVKRAVVLQDADAELSEVERIVRTRGDRHRRLLRQLQRPAQQRRDLLLAVRPTAAGAGLKRRDPGARRSAEAAADVIARARVGRVGEHRLGVGELDQRPGRLGGGGSRLKKAVWSATRAACCMLWVTMTIVKRPLRLCISSSIEAVAIGSSAEAGSSSSSTSGSIAIARAMQSRCCWPPESPRALSLSRSLTSSQSAAPRSAPSTRSSRPCFRPRLRGAQATLS